MSTRLYRMGALLALACAPLLAQAQPSFNHARETQRLQNYAIDVLRNNRSECRELRGVQQRNNGKIEAVCTSNNQRRELKYLISPPRDDRHHGGYRNQMARVDLLSSIPVRGPDRGHGHGNDRGPHGYR